MGAGAIAAAAANAGAAGAQAYATNGGGEEQELVPVVEQRMVDSEHTVGRNDPCWCGSGKKFKKCHGPEAVQEARRRSRRCATGLIAWDMPTTASTESVPQRLAAIRDQLKLLADYL